jgi:hypothetical protein
MKLYLLFVLLSACCMSQAGSSSSLGSPLAQNPRRGLTWQEKLQYYLCCYCCKKQDRPEEDDEDDQIVLDAKYELRRVPVKKISSQRKWYE